MTDKDPLIYPGMPPLKGYTCPACGSTKVNKSVQYHYQSNGTDRLTPVLDGEICDRCGGLVPMT